MSLKNKVFQIILRVVCAVMLVIAIFLGVVAAFYSLGGGVPNIFGSNIYLVKTDAFDLLHNGTALVAKQVHPSEIMPGNIVIFNIENNMPALGEIQTNELVDGVHSFTALTENGKLIVLSQSQIVAKGTSFSDFWGAVIGFAVSPIGMLVIAVLPCVVIIVIEISKFVGKIMPQPEIETVKKQLEVPTYSPEFERNRKRSSGRAAAIRAYSDSDDLDDSIGLYDAKVKRSTSVEREHLESRSADTDPLFYSPKRQPQRKQTSSSSMPLSSKKLNEAIAASKAERELLAMSRLREETVKEVQKNRSAAIAAEKEQENVAKSASAAAKKTAEIPVKAVTSELSKKTASSEAENIGPTPLPKPESKNEFKPEFKAPQRQPKPALRLSQDDNVKQYNPTRQRQVTTSIPRLDSLLNEDTESTDKPSRNYDIDDILAGIDRKR